MIIPTDRDLTPNKYTSSPRFNVLVEVTRHEPASWWSKIPLYILIDFLRVAEKSAYPRRAYTGWHHAKWANKETFAINFERCMNLSSGAGLCQFFYWTFPNGVDVLTKDGKLLPTTARYGFVTKYTIAGGLRPSNILMTSGAMRGEVHAWGRIPYEFQSSLGILNEVKEIIEGSENSYNQIVG